MQIETLAKKDLKLYKELIDEAFDGSNSLDFYQKYNEDSNYIIFVAKKDNKIIGSVTAYKIDLFTFSFQPVLELFNVAVLSIYRKQNVGKELLNHVIDYAKKNGYKTIQLTCLDTAIPAHKLYESVGMEKASSIKYNLHLK